MYPLWTSALYQTLAGNRGFMTCDTPFVRVSPGRAWLRSKWIRTGKPLGSGASDPNEKSCATAVTGAAIASNMIIDLSMPNCGGIEALQVIKSECPNVRCLVLTMHDDQAFLQAVLDAGGLGYVTKEAVKQELIIAVRQVARGRQYISVSTDEGDKTQADYRKQMTSNAKGLSARERQVLSSVARGYTNKQIAEQLGVSKASVEQYRLRLSRKLGAKSRVDLVDYALQAGLLQPPKTS